MGADDGQFVRIDLTKLKCPRALIDLKISLVQLEKGQQVTVLLNTKTNNQDILSYIEASELVIERVEEEETTHIFTLSKS